MKPFLRLVAFVTTILAFNIDNKTQGQETLDLQISNPLARRIIRQLSDKPHFDKWTVDAARSGKNHYAIAATASLPDDNTHRRALLGINCINETPSVSLIFEGDGQQFKEPMPILIAFDNGVLQREIAMPMTGRDAVGIFNIRAFLTVQSMRNSNSITVFLPEISKSWKFSLSGLEQTITYMKSPCNFSVQDLIDNSEMTLLQIHLHHLGYNVPTNGKIDRSMEQAILQIQKKYGLKETGQIDDPTYDVILRIVPH